MLVLDASAALPALATAHGLEVFGGEELVAPPLLWSESRSVLHEALWRKELSLALAIETLARLDGGAIGVRAPSGLGSTAWRLADELGWAKTYDAEYLALAMLLGGRLVTLDARLRRRTEHLGFVVSPTELQ